MPFGYLGTLVIFGLCTAAALAPPRRPPLLARAAYILGMVVNEVPHLAAALLVASTVLAFVEGDLTGAGGAVLVVGAVLICAGLAVLAARGLRARRAVAEGLRKAGIGQPASIRGPLQVLLAPFPVRPWRVRRVAGLRYGSHRRQRLDVYRRRGQDTGGPVLVYLHGGGYSSGSKHREGRALLHRLAEQGWVCISASYRLRPGAGFAEHYTDAKRVVAWAHENAARHGGDPSTLVMSGSSAGAHLTSLCALTQGDPALQPGFETATTRVDAAICLYGYYGRYYGRGPDESPVSSPLALDAAAAPPFLVVHGDRDSWTRVEDARALSAKLRHDSPGPTVHVELPGGQHGFDLLRSWRFEAVLGAVDAFVARAVSAGGQAGPVRADETIT